MKGHGDLYKTLLLAFDIHEFTLVGPVSVPFYKVEYESELCRIWQDLSSVGFPTFNPHFWQPLASDQWPLPFLFLPSLISVSSSPAFAQLFSWSCSVMLSPLIHQNSSPPLSITATNSINPGVTELNTWLVCSCKKLGLLNQVLSNQGRYSQDIS